MLPLGHNYCSVNFVLVTENEDFPYEILVDSRAKVDKMFQQKDKPDETKYVDIINENSSRPKTIIFLFSQSLLNNSNYTFLYKG